jgi:predicted RNA binding protein YcfA (HicA-like mRNA interferase family)
MSYTGKQLIRVAKKLGYAVKEGGKHTLIYDPRSGRRITTIQRGFIPKGTLNAILKQMRINEAELKNSSFAPLNR